MTLLQILNSFIDTLTGVKPDTRSRYRYHAREVVRFYGADPRWNRVDYDKLVTCIPEEYTSNKSIVVRAVRWMGV